MHCLLRTHRRGAPTTIAKTEGRRHRTSQSSPSPESPVEECTLSVTAVLAGSFVYPKCSSIGCCPPLPRWCSKGDR